MKSNNPMAGSTHMASRKSLALFFNEISFVLRTNCISDNSSIYTLAYKYNVLNTLCLAHIICLMTYESVAETQGQPDYLQQTEYDLKDLKYPFHP